MKSSLWIVIALVTGIVGYLMGYSVSAYTGTRRADGLAAHAGAPPVAHAVQEGTSMAAPAAAGGYGAPAAAPATTPAAAGGYGAPAQAPKPQTPAAGY